MGSVDESSCETVKKPINELNKVVRDGMVAVLLSTDGGWYTLHHNLEFVFWPPLVRRIENSVNPNKWVSGFRSYARRTYGDVPRGDPVKLCIEWVRKDERFVIVRDKYGKEYIVRKASTWLVA